MAGLTTIPAYVRTADDENVMEMALIENIQRQDLNALEIALAYQHLLEQYDLTQDRLSERVGKKRATITNYLRLLKLPAQVQMALQKRTIDMGHARALLSLDSPSQQLEVYEEILRTGASVRQVEEMVRRIKNGEKLKDGRKQAGGNRLPEEFNILKDQLEGFFSTKVSLNISPAGKGKITIPFDNEEELERIMNVFDNMKQA